MSVLPPARIRDRLGEVHADHVESIPPSRAATREHQALQRVLDQHAPACQGDDRFTADAHTLARGDVAALRAICGTCPALAECRAYAAASRPAAGVWAGTSYPRKEAPQ
ncbi:WhiB family transcriptional regulator [Microbacterium sp. G2-8]|uniref:WhiB family transcriptional regulator n=1 Tax=Microbacterium sp. G2-8 TaxID=2842454 RepID=UPI001C8A7C24|nr:WhiB family transcriptional regulator [Microbacterium sp. G2-8]